jgi:hypothetical protein
VQNEKAWEFYPKLLIAEACSGCETQEFLAKAIIDEPVKH